ncbi:[protein-PII] uridylyltransferase [Alcaligenaceae bacterium SJ-26]|nr:[protein-PII] uridylyltransferase [Alcaligenaceae bacterium SJ-26]
MQTPSHLSLPLSDLRKALQDSRAAAIEVFRQQRQPNVLLRSLCRLVDQTLRGLLQIHPLPAGSTLAALGGYGRGELYPYSDIDILILLPRAPDAQAETAIGEFLTAMWDIGLEPGHSVRTIDECISEARGDITVETALLESRWIAGSRNLMRDFSQQIHQHLDAPAFFLAKRAEMRQRHSRFRDTPYSLEPNCKESPGGLRDLQVILWMARAAGFGDNWRAIARAGLLTPQEARDLNRAEQAFKRLRIELHLLARRREDRILFDWQSQLATVYGIEPSPTRRASELLMQRYYWAARLVTQLNTILVQNIEERLFPRPDEPAIPIDDSFCSVHQRLDICRDDAFERKPALLLRAFLVMQQHPELQGMSARTLRALWHNRDRIDAQFRSNPINKKIFLQILQQPRGIVHALRDMTMLNILPRFIPAFRRIVGQMQHDLFHVYTVDQHTLMVIRNLRRFTMPEHAPEHPLASQLINDFSRHWLLYVAALFHDIAKGRGGDHSELGAREIKRFARDFGLAPADAELVEFLVRQHLSMSNVAQKQDLSDPDVIHRFAALVKTKRQLQALYLLTVADIQGTSPKVWNAWKGKLLEDLYRAALAILGGARHNRSSMLHKRRQEAEKLLLQTGLPAHTWDTLWDKLDTGYFLRHESDELSWHAQQLHAGGKLADTPVVRARATEHGEGLQILVWIRDVADLFARICAYLDRSRLSILDARIHTTRDGWALDSFIVLPLDEEIAPQALATEIEQGLGETLAQLVGTAPQPVSVTDGSQRRPPQSRRSRTFPIAPQVELHQDEQGQLWRLSLTAADRPGLLHDVARIFGAHGLNLHTAKIMTLGDRVEDVFVLSGAAFENPRQCRQLERDLRTVMSAESMS